MALKSQSNKVGCVFWPETYLGLRLLIYLDPDRQKLRILVFPKQHLDFRPYTNIRQQSPEMLHCEYIVILVQLEETKKRNLFQPNSSQVQQTTLLKLKQHIIIKFMNSKAKSPSKTFSLLRNTRLRFNLPTFRSFRNKYCLKKQNPPIFTNVETYRTFFKSNPRN